MTRLVRAVDRPEAAETAENSGLFDRIRGPWALRLIRPRHPIRHYDFIRDVGVAGSNPVTPTIENNNLFATDGRNISGSHLLKCAVSAEGSISNRTWPMKVSVRRFKSLAIGLKELEPFIRNGQHLATGRPFKGLNGMRSREALQSHQ